MATAIQSKSGGGLTWDDYLRFPEDGRRHEIIAGEHYVTASPVLDHQRVSRHIQFQLYEQIERVGKGEVFNAPTAVQLSEFDVVEPDLLVVLTAHSGRLRERTVAGPPDLVVEVLSPSTRRVDRGVKLALYQRARVGEYWIVDPVARQVEKHLRQGDALQSAGVFTGEVTFDGLPGVAVDLGRVWNPPWRRPR